MLQSQSLQLKFELQYEMVSSHTKMQAEFKDNLEEFFQRFMRFQLGTPPPPGPPADTIISNIGQLSDHQSALGENSPVSLVFLHLYMLKFNL
jgi:hypothetical protein